MTGDLSAIKTFVDIINDVVALEPPSTDSAALGGLTNQRILPPPIIIDRVVDDVYSGTKKRT